MEMINKQQLEDAEALAAVPAEKTTKDQEKSRVLVLVANAFSEGLSAGAGIAKLKK